MALPGLVLAGFGLLHPGYLDASDGPRLVDAARLADPGVPADQRGDLGAAARRSGGRWPWLARVAAYAFATFYTGLDVLAGIGAGLVTDVQQGGSPAVGRLFEIGDRLGETGVLALLAQRRC